jgi:hypothetical protein
MRSPIRPRPAGASPAAAPWRSRGGGRRQLAASCQCPLVRQDSERGGAGRDDDASRTGYRVPRALRARGAPADQAAIPDSAGHDPQPVRRRGPGPGDPGEGLRGVQPVPARHQPAGLAVPHPGDHVHQQLPQAPPGARPAAARRPSRAAGNGGSGEPAGRVGGVGGAQPAVRLGCDERAAGAAGRVRGGDLPGRHRGLSLPGDRRHPGHPDRHRDVPAASRPGQAAVPLRGQGPAPHRRPGAGAPGPAGRLTGRAETAARPAEPASGPGPCAWLARYSGMLP